MVSQLPKGFSKVVFSADCDEDGNCPECGEDYVECPCPGPTEDGVDYREINGVLYGRRRRPINGESILPDDGE